MADVTSSEATDTSVSDKHSATEARKASPAAETLAQQDTVQDQPSDVPNNPQVEFKITYGKHTETLKRPATSTIGELKAEVERTLQIPPNMQKLMFKGLLKNDSDTLEKVGIKNGAKVLLIGSSQADIAAAKGAPGPAADGSKLSWDTPKQEEDISKQPQHAKVIAAGVPEDATPGIKDKQVPLPDSMLHFNGLYNSTGSKVRLTFKPESQQLWIASATSTQKSPSFPRNLSTNVDVFLAEVPYSSITKIESWKIEAHEGYSILALHLGSSGSSKYWLYFFPSQYVSGIKIRLIGLHALL